jgi:exonuclease SbcC
MCARLADNMQRQTASIKELEQRLMDLEEQANLQKKELQNIGLIPDLNMEELRSQITSFDDQMTSIKAELEAGTRNSKTSHQRITDLAEKSQCPLCQQPLEKNYMEHMIKHFEEENAERAEKVREMQRNLLELDQLRKTANNALSKFLSFNPVIQDLKPRILDGKKSKEKLEKEFGEQQLREKMLRGQLEEIRKEISRFDMSQLHVARKEHDEANKKHQSIKIKLDYCIMQKKEVSIKIEDLKQRLENAQAKVTRVERIGKMLETIEGIRNGYQSIQPKLRTEFVKVLEKMMQRVLDNLRGEEGSGLIVQIDDAYTPSIKSQEGYELEVSHLSGGERTLLAFAYRFALGQLIMQARTGHGLQMLLLDEPTESLGREDRSVDRLAEAIARLKAIEQIIAVTHNEAFAEKAENVIRLEKEIDVSRVVLEK